MLFHRYRNRAESNHNLQPRNRGDGGSHSRGTSNIQGNVISDKAKIQIACTIKAENKEKAVTLVSGGFLWCGLNAEKVGVKDNLKSSASPSQSECSKVPIFM